MTADTKKIRVRFAPSPTGNLHIGGLRTALFNYLYARHNEGTFLIRIEDTDIERSKEEYMHAQLASLAWAGITSDEPLIFQSQRSQAYKNALEHLLQKNKIYRCICTPEEVEKRARAAGIQDDFFGYDRLCRDKAIDANIKVPFVFRCAVPDDIKTITVTDLIRGTVVFERDQFDDFIIVRSDGSPMYNFAVVVDDLFMNITHVIRGEEHLGNTPKQILLYQALGGNLPQFAHIPLILSPQGGKLSKRDGAVDVLAYKQEGYLADALVNYIARLGWAHGDQELFTRDELIRYFSLEAVGKKSAVFDMQKLQWVNSMYLKHVNTADCFDWLVADVAPHLPLELGVWDRAVTEKALGLYQGRVKTGAELYQALLALYKGPADYNEADISTWMTTQARDVFDSVTDLLSVTSEFSVDALSEVVKNFCKERDIKLTVVAQPLRIALTGGATSPGVFELLGILGKTESLKRINALQSFLRS